MSSKKPSVAIKESSVFKDWMELSREIKIMDYAILGWLAISIIEIILMFTDIPLNIRTFPAFLLPIFMFVVTFALRLKLNDDPSSLRQVFIAWVSLFALILLAAIIVLFAY
ncbi:MAG: hypothetical protein U9O98_10080, partial [Asgard group archaeon]|nr:hypothetical protein [Asgard group archaeon]